MNKIIVILCILSIIILLCIAYQSWKQNEKNCSCRKAQVEGMSTKDMTSEILARMTNIINTLNGMSNELNKIKEWLTVHNDTLDKKTVIFQLVNLSGNLANMSSEISHISDAAYTYSQTIGNSMVQQMISNVANDLGNQSIILRNASNDLMIWSEWIEQNNRLNEIPLKLAELESKLSEIAVYFTNLSNQFSLLMQTNP
jgi:hypothetical protein